MKIAVFFVLCLEEQRAPKHTAPRLGRTESRTLLAASCFHGNHSINPSNI